MRHDSPGRVLYVPGYDSGRDLVPQEQIDATREELGVEGEGERVWRPSAPER